MISSIVLAAGMSTRMGEPKALLDWEGEPLVCYQVRQLREAGVDEVIVVLGHRADDIQREMKTARCRVLLNARYQMGRAGSLRIGAKGVDRDADAIVVVNVDQPRPASFLRALIEARDPNAAVTRPVSEGRHGHPVIVAGSLRSELQLADDETGGLRGIVYAHADSIQDVPMGPECLIDLNTPDDLAPARQALHTG